MANVLITGGTGFVGHWMNETRPKDFVCILLNRHGHELIDLIRVPNYDYVVHLAPIHPARAVECARRNNARLLYCSSGIVYHPENDIQYRRDKLDGEKYCLDSGVDVVLARLFTFFGDRLDDNKAYTQFTKAARQNSPIEIWGDGKTVRSYMHGSELGRWMWAILLRGVSGEAYDVGDDEPVTMLELAQAIKELHHSTSEITVKGGASPMPCYLPVDTAKTKALL